MGKILALDIGKKRVGYAVSDAEAKVAFPRESILAKPLGKFLQTIAAIVKEEKIGKIVLGLPLDDENHETAEARSIKKLGEKLRREFGIPVAYVDEFGSTKEALSKIPLRKHRREKGRDDAVAAQIILERYMEMGVPLLTLFL